MHDDTGPYASAAWQYRQAGYAGIIPLGREPGQKSPPPARYTGWAGIDPSGPDVQAWIDGPQGARNIGWHLPRGYLGVDVDAYHRGAESLAKLEDKIGHPLPATWTSTARGPGSVSRHHFYRAPLADGRTWRDHPGDGIDSLHVGHRYAMVWPSTNPDHENAVVCWYDPSGELYEGVPDPSWFTSLDEAWIAELSQEGVPLEGTGATDRETASAIERMRPGPACPRVTAHLGRERDRIAKAAAGLGSLHEPGGLYPLVAYGLEGHAGVREALAIHQSAYVKARSDGRGETEAVGDADWWRQVRGAVGKRLHLGAGLATECACAEVADETTPPEEPTIDPVEALLSRMLDRDALDRIPPPRPLIRGVLDLDSESWIIGAPGGFKSFVALDWTGHVACGLPWRGQPVQRGRVVYVVAEGSKSIALRVKAWEETYGHRITDALFLPEPVQVKDGETDKTGRPGREWRVLVEACRRLQPVLIVLDTQARITVGLEENSNTSMGVLVEAVRSLKEATKACVLVVHHTGRNGEDARGASALDGAQDTEIRVDRPIGPRRLDLTAEISTDKQKDGDESVSWPVQMRIVGLGEHEGRPLSSLAVEPWDPFAEKIVYVPEWDMNLTMNQSDVLLAMRKIANHERGATGAEVRMSGDEMRAERGAPKFTRTGLYVARDALVEKDLIVVVGSRWYLAEHAPE
jgi:hypothetical protein